MNSVPYLDSPVCEEKISLGSPSHEFLGVDAYMNFPLFSIKYVETCAFPTSANSAGEEFRYYFLIEYPRGLFLSTGASGAARSVSGIWRDQKLMLPFSQNRTETNRTCYSIEELATSAFVYIYKDGAVVIAARINGVYKKKNHILIKSFLRVPEILLNKKNLDKQGTRPIENIIQAHSEAKDFLAIPRRERLINHSLNIHFSLDTLAKFTHAELKQSDDDQITFDASEGFTVIAK
jgi:hypothetical protein